MLKLLVESQIAQTPVIPVRWCVNSETADKLKAEGVVKAYLFVVS